MKTYIEQQEKSMMQMLEEVVNIDSGSYDKAGVDAHGQYWIDQYGKIGFTAERFRNEVEGDNILLTHKDADSTQINTLILLHLDTVFEKGTASERPFSLNQEGTEAYGPGVIDMKASHVLVYTALKALIEKGLDGYKNVEILLNSDEEIGSHASRELIEARAKGKDWALVMEPARKNGAIVSARRGVGNYRLEIKGKAAHAGIEPENGISAIEELSYKIQELHALSDFDAGLSVNVGLISGGSSVNTVAPNATCAIDVRISTKEQGVEIDKKIREVCKTPHLKGIELTLTGGINRPPMVKDAGTEALLHHIYAAAKEIDLEFTDIHTGGGSDASFTADVGTATVDGLGPIGGGQHSEAEYLVVPSFTERTLLFTHLLPKLIHGR